MQDLILTDKSFDRNPYWEVPLNSTKVLIPNHHDLFDQNGYDLTQTEKMFAMVNESPFHHLRTHIEALRQHWITQNYKNGGAVLNHGLLFERKGYRGEALEQLKSWAKQYPYYYRMINIKPKWGLDFSIDYYDSNGNTLEVLHWEYDGFNVDEILEMKEKVEPKLISIDWDDAALHVLKHKDEWYNLDFFGQSAWKCDYFGIGGERWKMVVWE